MAIRFFGQTANSLPFITGLSTDPKPETMQASACGMFVETDTNKMFIYSNESWTEIIFGGSGDMLKSENLSGLANYTTARTNLGLGALAVKATVAIADIDDDAVTLAKMAAGTAGNLITYDASGNPAAVATGTTAQVLTSNGVGAAPTFQTAVGGNDPRITTKALTADQTISSTTMAKVTGLDQTVAAGTYWFEYRVIWQTTVTATAIKLGVNFSGTQTRFVTESTMTESTTAASAGTADQVHAAFGLKSGGASRAPSTTVSIFGPTTADTVSADMLAIIKGVIVITVQGDLQLYFGSEATGSTQTIESGSALRLTKVSA